MYRRLHASVPEAVYNEGERGTIRIIAIASAHRRFNDGRVRRSASYAICCKLASERGGCGYLEAWPMEHLMNHADTPRRGPDGRENFSQIGFLRIALDGPDQVRFSVTMFDL